MSIPLKQRLRGLARSAWFYLVAIVSVLAASAVARALRDDLGGVLGVVLGIAVALVLGFVLTLGGLIVSAWWAARRARLAAEAGEGTTPDARAR